MKNKQKIETRKKKKNDVMQSRDRVSTFIAISATTIIQLPTSSTTNSINVLINIRFSRLKTELVTRDHYNFQRFISRVYNREITVISIVPVPEQRINNPIHVDLKAFIDEMKENATPHNRRTLKNAKMKLLNKHYKFHHIQKWKGDDFEHKWEKLGIEPGIERDLIDNVGAFERRQLQSDRALLPVRTSTVFTKKRVLNSIEDEQSAKGRFDNELNLDGERYDDEED